MLKSVLCFLMLSIGLVFPALAAEYGYITVVTGEPKARIFLDGQFTANEFIRRYPVEPGKHAVRIEYDGKLMYSEIVSVKVDEAIVVSSEHFVDIRTNVANRGAIDRESRRLKEVKGAFGVGVMAGLNFPASGASAKWYMLDWVGVQLSAIGDFHTGDAVYTQLGARLLIPIGQRVLGNSVLTGYLAPGYARVEKSSSVLSENYEANVFGVAVGLEWAPFDPFYFSGEIGAAYESRVEGNSSVVMNAAVGLHVFF
jgi:hypothetical protein